MLNEATYSIKNGQKCPLKLLKEQLWRACGQKFGSGNEAFST